jgi:subtilisin-like proprotein convertase family protein
MNMKQILILAMAVTMSAAAYGQVFSTNLNGGSGYVIPDNNPSGVASLLQVSGVSGVIGNVTLTLDITGGYNGDLYAYLAGPSGGFAVLLNRTGVSATSGGGYGDTGFSVTFDDSGSNPDVHFYQNNTPAFNGNGQLTGTWGSDGENINPQSPQASFTGTPTATLTSFDGDSANGQWTLFLADLAAGNQSTIVSWSVNIATAVPEPQTWVLGAMGLVLLAAGKLRGRKQKLIGAGNGEV